MHKIPHRHNPLLRGFVTLRGHPELCFSLRAALGIPTAEEAQSDEAAHSMRMILVIHQQARFVFEVDEVLGTRRFIPDELRAVPSTVELSPAPFVEGLLDGDPDPVAHLDPELLFHGLTRAIAEKCA